MRHNSIISDEKFIKIPEEFSKKSDRDFLRYCLGATLYMPAMRNFSETILSTGKDRPTSMVICFEDAIDESLLSEAEKNTVDNLEKICENLKKGHISTEEIPLIFLRVRNTSQFREIISKIERAHLGMITGFVFPKFSSQNGEEYLEILEKLISETGEILYGMPILETKEIVYSESRKDELQKICEIINRHEERVLNIRIGGTDFSSCFGVRRGIDYSVYDIVTVRDCIADILNYFTRENRYTVSGPVWEYFLASKEMRSIEERQELKFSLQSSILKRKKLINQAIDGLIREVVLDKANGMIGKTIIHPTHIRFVNAMYAVTEEEYNDAVQILETPGGVSKSPSCNKMNEISPHTSWAIKICQRARAYGVVADETIFLQDISETE